MIKVSSEREAFRLRLQQALRAAHFPSESPTELARDFNARFDGRPITVHAARKWLVGEAIPTQDKMRALARWLDVSVEWLRFGGEEQALPARSEAGLNSEDAKLMAELQYLNPQDQQVVREIIRMFLRKSDGRSRG